MEVKVLIKSEEFPFKGGGVSESASGGISFVNGGRVNCSFLVSWCSLTGVWGLVGDRQAKCIGSKSMSTEHGGGQQTEWVCRTGEGYA